MYAYLTCVRTQPTPNTGMYVCTTAHNHSTQKNVKHVYTCLQHNDNLSYKEQVYMHSTTVVTPTGLPNNQ